MDYYCYYGYYWMKQKCSIYGTLISQSVCSICVHMELRQNGQNKESKLSSSPRSLWILLCRWVVPLNQLPGVLLYRWAVPLTSILGCSYINWLCLLTVFLGCSCANRLCPWLSSWGALV